MLGTLRNSIIVTTVEKYTMEENNKRIIKNTIYLYFRLIVIMALSFVSTRIVLDKLGASDYGVNNVVAGFVSMFTLLNSILQTGTRRFLALNLGKDDANLQKRTFSTAFVIHLIVAAIVVVLLESMGIWFLNSKLNIEPDRMVAANWIFQFSVLTVLMNITQTPYTAAVTAHEKFNIYAYMSILDVVLKIAVLFLLVYIPFDKLIVYGFLSMCVSLINISVYRVYCIRNFSECGFSLRIDRPLFRDMMTFSWWSTMGHFIVVLNNQGMSIMLNIFFNTVVNAARGLASTVVSTVNQFVGGFIVAAEPQLVKYYGAGDMKGFYRLIFNISQYSLFLLAIFLVPVVLEIDYVLGLWLTEVPQYTAAFIKISVAISVIHYANQMVDRGVVAAGRVKELSVYSAPIYLILLPIAYIVLKKGWNPTMVYYIDVLPNGLAFLMNLFILKRATGFPAGEFLLKIFTKNAMLIILSSAIPFVVQTQMEQGLLRFLVVCSLSVIATVSVMWIFALNKETRKMVLRKIIKKKASNVVE